VPSSRIESLYSLLLSRCKTVVIGRRLESVLPNEGGALAIATEMEEPVPLFTTEVAVVVPPFR